MSSCVSLPPRAMIASTVGARTATQLARSAENQRQCSSYTKSDQRAEFRAWRASLHMSAAIRAESPLGAGPLRPIEVTSREPVQERCLLMGCFAPERGGNCARNLRVHHSSQVDRLSCSEESIGPTFFSPAGQLRPNLPLAPRIAARLTGSKRTARRLRPGQQQASGAPLVSAVLSSTVEPRDTRSGIRMATPLLRHFSHRGSAHSFNWKGIRR